MKSERSKWMCSWLLAFAACELQKGEVGDDEEGSDVETGSISETGPFASGTATSGGPGDASCSTYGEEGTASATVTSATTYGSDDGGEDEVGSGGSSGGSSAQCGVELVYDGSQTSFMCGCTECSIQYDGISEASGEALLNVCDCICDVFDCGGSVSGGVTTNAEDDGGSWSGTGESGGGEVDSGWDTDSASGTATSSTTGYGDDGG